MPEQVWKFPVGIPDGNGVARVVVPRGTRIVSFGMEPDDSIVCWGVVLWDAQREPKQIERFVVLNTGVLALVSAGEHRATLRTSNNIVWHVFDLAVMRT